MSLNNQVNILRSFISYILTGQQEYNGLKQRDVSLQTLSQSYWETKSCAIFCRPPQTNRSSHQPFQIILQNYQEIILPPMFCGKFVKFFRTAVFQNIFVEVCPRARQTSKMEHFTTIIKLILLINYGYKVLLHRYLLESWMHFCF